MGKLLEVREFDTITDNVEFKFDEKYKYLNNAVFQDLIKFIREFTVNEDNVDALNFMRIGYKRNVGDVITIKNYVGIIQMKNGYQVQVLPKISFVTDDAGNKETKRIFLKMLKSMKDFPSKVFNDANLKIDRMNLYEIFINMYIQEVRQLIKRGLKSDYISLEGNIKYYKGKLLTNQHIRSNIIHKEQFYVSYDEFHLNRVENRLIKSTLLKLHKLTNSAENAKEIRQLLIGFEMVYPSQNYIKDFSKVIIDRNTKNYEILMQWSKVFLLNKSFTTFSGENISRALLFPMESVYENYVAQNVKKVFGLAGWTVLIQNKGGYLFTEPKKQFALRPDIVCHRNGRIVIMDTKWKNLINNERANYGILQSDMYQMYAYSKKYGASEIFLLYPLNDDMKDHKEIRFDSGDGTVIRLHFIDVAHIEETLIELRDKMEVLEF